MTDPPAPDSPGAARRLARADIEAAYRKHGHSVLRRATHLLGSAHEANEILQELFTSLLERPQQFAGQSSLLTWLYAATTHRCLNRLRDAAARSRLIERERHRLLMPSEPCAADRHFELRGLLRALPEELAAVAVHHHLDALSYDEIAVVLGCSRRKVAYLMERLREHASKEESPDGKRR